MATVKLFKQTGAEAGTIELSSVFEESEELQKKHEQAVFDTVIAELAGMRQGTQKAKGRHEVSGGGKKPWRQKGTGRARQGSTRAAQWVGGGVIFAPTPRDHSIKVNKKVVCVAKRSILSQRVREGKMIVLDSFKLEAGEKLTKRFVEVLKALNVADKKVIVVLGDYDEQVMLGGRNVASANVQSVNHASVYQLMNAEYLVITEEAVRKYEEALK